MTEPPPPSFELPAPYATADHLAGYWRALTEGERTRAAELLRWAALVIDEEPGSDDFDPATAAMVSLDMVKRAMLRGDGDGVSETTTNESMADMTGSTTVRYVNPVGNLYLTAQERNRLSGKNAQPAAGSIALSSNVRVPGQPWNRQPNLVSGDDGNQP